MSGSNLLLIFLAAVVVGAVAGTLLARMWRLKELTAPLIIVLVCVLSGIAVTVAGWPPKTGIDLHGGTMLIYGVQGDLAAKDRPEEQGEDAAGTEAKSLGMEVLIAAVARRVNPGKVKEVTIRSHGKDQLEIVVPETDPEEIQRLERILGRVGALEFRILANQRDDKALIEQALAEKGTEVKSEQGRLEAWWVPVAQEEVANLRKFPEIALRTVDRDGQKVTEVLVVKDDFDVTGAYLRQAVAGTNPLGQQGIQYELNPSGGQRMGNLTGGKTPDEVGSFTRKLGFLVDGQLISASPIKEAMFQFGEIRGTFNAQQFKDLADVFNAGALPTALSATPVRELAVGPTLGSDTIRRGALAIGVCLALVFVLLIVCYRFAGVVACGAILLSLALVLALLILVKVVLTLSGLVGLLLAFVLSVGVQVLILERIGEELDREAPLRTAIRNGFSKARPAILDVGAAILIMASVFFFVGSSEIKGFAVTLWLGTVMSWVGAVYCSRAVLDIAERRRWITHLKMMRLRARSDRNMLRLRTVAGIASALAVVLGIVVVSMRGPDLPGRVFSGGIAMELQFEQPQTVAEVRRSLPGLTEASVFAVEAAGEPAGRHFVVNAAMPAGQAAGEYAKEVEARIGKALAGKLVRLEPAAKKTPVPIAASAFGSKLSENAREHGIYALLVSLLCIMGYLWVRFQRPYYGLAAMVALAHDVAITLGLLAVCQYVAPYAGFLGIESFRVGLPEAAGLLAVVGLSLAGTIVVLDRVREVRGKTQLLTEEKVNTSLNQLVGHTVVTLVAMLLVAGTLYVAGGPGIHGLAFVLLVGVVVTTYSPIFVAAPFLLWMSRPAVNVGAPPPAPAPAQRGSKGKKRS